MTTKLKLRTATFKHIESELYNYQETIKEIQKLRNDIMFATGSDDENVGGGRSSEPGRPTERIATKLTSHKTLIQLEEIVSAIQKVYVALTKDHQTLIEMRYWTKPQTLTWDGLAEKLHVSKRQALRWRDKIVEEIAKNLGWR